MSKSTIIRVVRGGPYGEKGVQITFVDRDTAGVEPLRLYLHEVELRKLSTGIAELLAGIVSETGVEGVTIEYQ